MARLLYGQCSLRVPRKGENKTGAGMGPKRRLGLAGKKVRQRCGGRSHQQRSFLEKRAAVDPSQTRTGRFGVGGGSFMEKQLWFLKQLDKLQVPYRDGCIRMEWRDYLLLDTVVLVGASCRATCKWWRMQFAGEAGIDAGGLEREWFSMVAGSLFDPEAGLFSTPTSGSGSSGGGAFHINPTSADSKKDHLQYFKVAGRMFGKALMEQQTLNAPLSLPLRKMLLNIPITFSDLEFCDPTLYRSILYVRDCPQRCGDAFSGLRWPIQSSKRRSCRCGSARRVR